jgi:hypothetical protein
LVRLDRPFYRGAARFASTQSKGAMMKTRGLTIGFLMALAGSLAATRAAEAGVMLAFQPENMSNTIIIFIVGVIVGALIVYFLRRR